MLFCGLYLLWILLNARVTAEILILGLPVAGAVYLLSVKALSLSPRRDFARLRRLPAAAGYLCFLFGQVVVSALRVVRLIWSPGKPVSAVASFDPELRTEAGRVILADSITLTPGTITLEAEDGRFLVHCLEASSADSVGRDTMRDRAARLEGTK